MNKKEKKDMFECKRKTRYTSRVIDRFLLLPVGRKIVCLACVYLGIAGTILLGIWWIDIRSASGNDQAKTKIVAINSGPAYMRDLFDCDTLTHCPGATAALVFLGLCGGIGWSFFTAFLISMYNRREDRIRNGFSRYAPCRWERHAVILGWGPMGVEAVRLLREKHACRDIVIISDMSTLEIREALITAFSEGGFDVPGWLTIYKGDCGAEKNLMDLALPRAEQLLYLGDWTKDVDFHDSRALCALTLISKLVAGRPTPLPCHICIRSVGLFNQLCLKDLPESDAKVIDFQPFNPSVDWARKLWSVFPKEVRPYPALAHRPLSHDSCVHLFIIGFGYMGQALAAHAARIVHYPTGVRMQITVIDPFANVLREEFLAYFPVDRLSELSISVEFMAARAESSDVRKRLTEVVSDNKNVVTVAICIPEPDAALETATRLMDGIKDASVSILLRQRAPLSPSSSIFSTTLLMDLYVFGAETDCGLDNALDRLAKAAHAAFLAESKKQGNYSPATKLSHREWSSLPAIKRQSNRNQTDAILERLAAWHYEWESADQADVPIRQTDIESLAEAEHRRWWAEYILSGWQYGPTESANQHTHPCMIPYDDLSDGIKKYDRLAIENMPSLLNQEYGVRLFKRG